MARRKTTRGGAKASGTQLPKGYEAISGFGRSWPNDDTNIGDMIEGKITGFDEIEVKRGKKTETVEKLTLETKDGTVWTLWQSSGLRPLFEYEEGTQIAVIYDGMGRAKRGQNAPRLYRIGVK